MLVVAAVARVAREGLHLVRVGVRVRVRVRPAPGKRCRAAP